MSSFQRKGTDLSSLRKKKHDLAKFRLIIFIDMDVGMFIMCNSSYYIALQRLPTLIITIAGLLFNKMNVVILLCTAFQVSLSAGEFV